MYLPFVNLGAKFQPDKVDVHTLCLQHTLVRLLLTSTIQIVKGKLRSKKTFSSNERA